MKQVQRFDVEQIGFHEKLQYELSNYFVKTITSDGSLNIQQVHNPYFLINDIWNLDFLEDIPQFQEMVEKYTGTKRKIYFQINSPSMNLELKYIFHQKLFREEWALGSIFNSHATRVRKLAIFLNERYSTLPSLLELDMEKAEREWWFWLEQQGVSTQKNSRHKMYGEYTRKTPEATFLRSIHSSLFELIDDREEWEKDRWNVRVLHDNYGIEYNKSSTDYNVNFTNIEQKKIREQVKKYSKQRLLNKSFSWGALRVYFRYLPKFFSFMHRLEPTWEDLKGLKRYHIEQYIQWLHEYTKKNLKKKNAHPEDYMRKALLVLKKVFGRYSII